MQNPTQKFKQNSIVFDKAGTFSEEIVILNTFSTYQYLQEGVLDFLFCLGLELFTKIKKYLASTQ